MMDYKIKAERDETTGLVYFHINAGDEGFALGYQCLLPDSVLRELISALIAVVEPDRGGAPDERQP